MDGSKVHQALQALQLQASEAVQAGQACLERAPALHAEEHALGVEGLGDGGAEAQREPANRAERECRVRDVVELLGAEVEVRQGEDDGRAEARAHVERAVGEAGGGVPRVAPLVLGDVPPPPPPVGLLRVVLAAAGRRRGLLRLGGGGGLCVGLGGQGGGLWGLGDRGERGGLGVGLGGQGGGGLRGLGGQGGGGLRGLGDRGERGGLGEGLGGQGGGVYSEKENEKFVQRSYGPVLHESDEDSDGISLHSSLAEAPGAERTVSDRTATATDSQGRRRKASPSPTRPAFSGRVVFRSLHRSGSCHASVITEKI
ncbi:Pecanex-like protein 1 [Frankliniella fusca]|uniref:Pecanex-like protein 1 n=1 Tax=Frankliniella fusca TaxID=407009 RepID=A0AAE1GUD2_9NEOP|nr:Pecanex-like protein 1 [Frankliniella fusca]